MRAPLVVALLLASCAAFAGDPPAAPGPAPVATPAAIPAPAPTPVASQGRQLAANGLGITAAVRPENLTGFPILVAFEVENGTGAAQSFPDLAARPHLVRFALDGPRGKSERYNTPPAFDVATSWTLAPRSERRVLLEIPSSGAFPTGDYTLTISILDPGGTVTFAPVPMAIRPAKPVAGTPIWEPTIAQNLGAIFPWVHDRGAAGSALYLMQFDARAQTRAVAQYWLADLTAAVDPVLSRSRPGDSFARFVYWMVPKAKTATVAYGKLDGTALRNGVRTAALPYPTAELIDRGVTDGKGQLVIPMWIPAPSGKGGSLKAWTLTERGTQALRSVVDLPAKPEVHATAIDAGSNLLLAISVAGGVDVYKVDATAPIEIPAKGTRHWVASAGWVPNGLAFETLPDAGERPGGLSLFSFIRSTTEGVSQWKAQWSDLGGKAFALTQGPWSLPGELKALVTDGYAPFYMLAQDAAGAWWYQPQSGAAVAVTAGGDLHDPALFISSSVVRARGLGGAGVVSDVALGPRQE